MLVVHNGPVSERVVEALRASAERLGHRDGCCLASCTTLMEHGAKVAAASAMDNMEPARLAALGIYDLDPWAVIGIDDDAIGVLRGAFGGRSRQLAPDAPLGVDGYMLVAVPGFEACLDEPDAKRVAWRQLQAARHPGNPLDAE